MMTYLLFLVGIVLLIAGAEALVRGASRLAAVIGISPLIIGLTVVAFGTSSPELAVSIKAAVSDQANIAVGNVIGSNIFNVLFILGLSALVTPLIVSQQLIRLDVPLMIAVSILVLILGVDLRFSRLDGLLLFLGLVVYIHFLIRQSRKETREIQDEYAREYAPVDRTTTGQWMINSALVAGGLVLLVIGAKWLVDSAAAIAHDLGVSDLIIGLTIIAAGTSLPEVATSVIAGIRGERDIAIGNVIGSNLFNMLGVLGLSSLIAPEGIQVALAVIRFDIPIMIAVSFACLPIFFTGSMISRWEGALLFGYYLAYTIYLFLAAHQHGALPMFNAAMIYFVIPLTVLTLIVVTVQAMQGKSKG